jgi:hypothetical protein
MIEDQRRGIANFAHDAPNFAGTFVAAICATAIGRDTGARDRCQRAIDDADDIAKHDGLGGLSQ